MIGSQLSSTLDSYNWRELALTAYEQVCADQPDRNAFHCYVAVRQQSYLVFPVSSHGDKALKRLTAMHGKPTLVTHPDAGIASKAMREHHSLLITDSDRSKDYKRTFPHMKTQLAIPLVRGTTTIGALVVECTHPNAFRPELVRNLEHLVRQFLGSSETPYNKRSIRDAILKMHLSTIEDVFDVKQLAEVVKPVEYFIAQLRTQVLPIISARISAQAVHIGDVRQQRPDIVTPDEQHNLIITNDDDYSRLFKDYEVYVKQAANRNKSSLSKTLDDGVVHLLMVLRNATDDPDFLIVFQLDPNYKPSDIKNESERVALDMFAKRLSQLYLTALIFEQQRDHNEQKQQFIQDVVHQLNSLAHALVVYCENLIDGDVYAPKDYVTIFKEMFDIGLMLEKYIRSYTLVTNDQRSLTEIYTQTPQIFDADQIIKLLRQCCKWFSAEALKVEVQRPEVVIKDFVLFPAIQLRHDLFELVIFNLLDNAVKYSTKYKNAPILIGARVESDYVVIKITNHGIALYSSDTLQIFDRGYRTSEAIRVKQSGTGIGLHLCQRIMELHNGKIVALASKASALIPDAHEVTFEIHLPME